MLVAVYQTEPVALLAVADAVDFGAAGFKLLRHIHLLTVRDIAVLLAAPMLVVACASNVNPTGLTFDDRIQAATAGQRVIVDKRNGLFFGVVKTFNLPWFGAGWR